jgi:ABC-2 type transport system ATP-binding protein
VIDHPLTAEGVSKRFGRREVLRGVDLRVPAGSVCGLLGGNGAGKTTLLRCLLGLARADAGTVSLLGEPSWDLGMAAKARLGYVPQTPAHLPWMRVDELIAYTGAFYPAWDAAHAESLRTRWCLPARARVAKLSPGEAQRLALVLALAHRPALLVLDEPAASLDPVARRDFHVAIVEAAGTGATVLLSTHLCADLERVADRVAVLRDGRIAVDAAVDDLKDRFRRLRVQSRSPLPAGFALPGLVARHDHADGAVLIIDGDVQAVAARLDAEGAAVVASDAMGLEDIALEMLR